MATAGPEGWKLRMKVAVDHFHEGTGPKSGCFAV